ncbi:MAG: tRNA preQ1(34) S-adenosylmethionine ribosyltransferase-isomerase QueA [bacterium]|nr:tRNA preQ1(34) S-adenosylmethionine ribosyltransferase-isomerase QueA [bacterium]
MLTSDFDYDLPEELIAQAALPRGESRMLVLERGSGELRHASIRDFISFLNPSDLLLLNDTRVIPARLWAQRRTGRRFELLLLRVIDDLTWECLLRPSAKARIGESLELSDGGTVTPQRRLGEGRWEIVCDPSLDFERLEILGEAPLPPYISRPEGATADDSVRYQTVYASEPGAIAAPTAGLHFTPEMIDEISAEGIEIAKLTLHVGIGTFKPVSVENVVDHVMHDERIRVTESAADAVNRALHDHRRIVCVGTTTVRALEGGLALGEGHLMAGDASTNIFITPGYRFRGAGALLTNFHLPQSTLVMMVSALAGRERIVGAYEEAVRKKYRFYSFGDAMLIV